MDFQIKILLVAFVSTVILGIIAIPILKKFKVGQVVRDDGPSEHLKKQGTPTMGGMILLISVVIMAIAAFFYYYTKEIEAARNIIPLVFVTLGFGLIGFIDDFKKLILKNTDGLKPAYKMIGLLIVSVMYVFYLTQGLGLGTETYIPIFKVYINLPIWAYIPFAIFILVSAPNAINLTDGLDGLAASVTTIIITAISVIAIAFEVKEVSVFSAIVVGSCLGFLVFNLHPAKVFMGDTGSLALGGAIAAMVLYLKMPLILITMAFVPIIETLSVAIQVLYFKKTKKRIFKMAPLHHHFELSGWRESHVVSIGCAITLFMCILSLYII